MIMEIHNYGVLTPLTLCGYFILEWKLLYFDQMSLKFIPKNPIDNILALAKLMHWRWSGNKVLSEPMMT